MTLKRQNMRTNFFDASGYLFFVYEGTKFIIRKGMNTAWKDSEVFLRKLKN